MKKITLLLVAIATLLLSSCATLSVPPTITGVAAPTSANFKYVDNITATETATYIFSFGGEDITTVALEGLRNQAKLQANQALANVAVSCSVKSILGIITKYTVTVNADVIEYTK